MVTGTNAAGVVLPRLAAQLAALRQLRADLAEKVEELVASHPLSKVLMTMPGVGVRTCGGILTEVVGKDFPTAGHLASYAGPRGPPRRRRRLSRFRTTGGGAASRCCRVGSTCGRSSTG